MYIHYRYNKKDIGESKGQRDRERLREAKKLRQGERKRFKQSKREKKYQMHQFSISM